MFLFEAVLRLKNIFFLHLKTGLFETVFGGQKRLIYMYIYIYVLEGIRHLSIRSDPARLPSSRPPTLSAAAQLSQRHRMRCASRHPPPFDKV